MQCYINELELLFTSGSRTELFKIEKRYDYTALLRQNDEYRSRWSITLLITVAACFFIDFTAMGQLEIFSPPETGDFKSL